MLEALESRLVMASSLDTAISGTIINDLNANGAKDPGEDGLSGWTVYLDDNLNGVLDPGESTQITNVDGDYLFQGLEEGNHRVRQVVQSGWTSTGPDFVDLFLRLDAEEKARFFNVFTGTLGTGSISGTVWNDIVRDGSRAFDPITGLFTEPGVADQVVYLDLDHDGSLSAGDDQAVSDADGIFSFSNLPIGNYTVRIMLGTGWEPTTGYNASEVVTVFQDSDTPLDFGISVFDAVTIQGTVWGDVDGDGIRATDPSTGVYLESGLQGWRVYVDENEDGIYSLGEDAAITDLNGDYTLFNVANGGTLEILLDPQANYITTAPFSGAYILSLANGQTATGIDFGSHEIQPAVIAGALWNDLDGDGVRAIDPMTGEFTEPGLADHLVYLDLDNDGTLSAGDVSTLTDAMGEYSFLGLAEGFYTVVEELPVGWEPAPGYDLQQTIFAYYDTINELDFGNLFTQPVTIQGTVWVDIDGNGSRAVDAVTGDFLEPGLEGRTVFVDSNNDGLLSVGEAFAVTNTNGQYSLTNQAHEDLTIRLLSIPDWNPTAPATGSYGLYTLNGESIVGIDFGTHPRSEASISGTVYADSNKNGVRDPGEKGLAGITVFLDTNNNGVLDAGETFTLTSSDLYFTPGIDETGSYSFTHLAAGTYHVREIVPVNQHPTPIEQYLHNVTLTIGQAVTGINSGNIYRANEIHGVRFNDLDGDHLRDLDEPGIAGATVYIDLDRDDVFDPEEPSAITGDDGSYAFYELGPDSYVIREVEHSGYIQTYPTTQGGILWPEGTSNLASGNVTPNSITVSLAEGEIYRQTVSLTLPGSGGVTNMVDVFLLFDDTGSFTSNSPIVRAAFPQIIASLQNSLPGIDFGFGVGRFEEYGNFAAEYATGRPFILNQAIIAASTSGFQTSIQAALDREAPGYGGDTPETLIEALYQTVTGLGFDGNNNGSVLDSGAAGLSSTQVNPGASGDVPSFVSFTADPTNNVLAPSGTVGGVGFRAGALPIILVATDTGFAYQPMGETSITGVGGVTLPITQLTQAARTTTPFDNGAGIQETITGLNALGALVIGLGVNAQSNLDPRQDLEAIATLTGAINNSTATIANGTADAIAPGDPFYFLISSGFGGTVANGVVNAIQNAATNVAMNITVRSSDPSVQIINHTGTVLNVGAGQTATFDVEFVGDGRPHRFDLQFIREGTGVVLGSIPVVIGTPIPGDGYEYEDLDEGEFGEDVDFGDVEYAFALPIANAGGGYVVLEGQSLALDATASQSFSGLPLTYQWDVNGDGIYGDVTGATPTLTWTELQALGIADGSASFQVKVRVTDGIADSDSLATSLQIINAAPVANLAGPTSGVRGQSLTYTLHATDASLADQAAGFTFAIDWNGDGTTDEIVTGADGLQVTHVYATNGSYNLSVTATDKDGGISSSSSKTVNVTSWMLEADPADSSKMDLHWGGTTGIDAFAFVPGLVLTQALNGAFFIAAPQLTFLPAFNGKIYIYAQGGDDLIYADVMSKDMIAFGGDGNDVLIGGRGSDYLDGGNGNDIIFGGTLESDGDDQIFGGAGNDFLVGHLGADVIHGGTGSDLLYAGVMKFTTGLPAAVFAIQTEWLSSRPMAVKIDNILGVGTGPRDNSTYFLQGGTTAVDDAAVDELFGDEDADWIVWDGNVDVTPDVDPLADLVTDLL